MHKRILAVDDDPSIREMVRDYFARNDFDVATAANGAEMRSALEGAPVDIVLLDVRMPGEDGFALARELRSRSNVPIIMLTAQGEEVDRVLGLELGADDYITKPVDFDRLKQQIKQLPEARA